MTISTYNFAARHIGPRAEDTRSILAAIGVPSIETLISQAVPKSIRLGRDLDLARQLEVIQVLEGRAHEHDDEHGVEHLLGWSIAHTRSARNIEDRAGYIKAIALLVSAVEAHDRKEQNGVG